MASQLKTKNNRPNLWLEHIAQSRQICIQQEVESQRRFHLFDGSTSWFKYEELIDDWLDLTVLEAAKRGPALENRLVGDAELYERLPNCESLRADDGVKFFRDTLRPHFINGFYQFTQMRRGHAEMVKWIGQFLLLLKRFKDYWMDMFPMSALTEGQRQNKYLADVAQENAGKTSMK